MDQIAETLEPLRQFSKDSMRLVNRCTKPDIKEFSKIAWATAIGVLALGGIGFTIRLVHLPILSLIVGA